MSNKGVKPTTSASMVAKYFLWRAREDDKRLTNKKLQKLLYYGQAWHLAINDAPLFRDPIEAWIHGPAVPDVYREYKQYGFSFITADVAVEEVGNIPGRDVLDEVWRVYGKFDGDYLERLTHSEIPWQSARENIEDRERSSVVIEHEWMREFYRHMMKPRRR